MVTACCVFVPLTQSIGISSYWHESSYTGTWLLGDGSVCSTATTSDHKPNLYFKKIHKSNLQEAHGCEQLPYKYATKPTVIPAVKCYDHALVASRVCVCILESPQACNLIQQILWFAYTPSSALMHGCQLSKLNSIFCEKIVINTLELFSEEDIIVQLD